MNRKSFFSIESSACLSNKPQYALPRGAFLCFTHLDPLRTSGERRLLELLVAQHFPSSPNAHHHDFDLNTCSDTTLWKFSLPRSSRYTFTKQIYTQMHTLSSSRFSPLEQADKMLPKRRVCRKFYTSKCTRWSKCLFHWKNKNQLCLVM